MMKKTEVLTATGNNACWSLQHNLIMLHSGCISAQWEPDTIGVEIMHTGKNIKVGMHPVRGNTNYQSFYFDIRFFEEILTFFKALGFPCPDPDPFMYHEVTQKKSDEK